MNCSFYNGICGVKSASFMMDVQANNISNVNTYGFRGSTPEVSTLFSTIFSGISPTSDKGLGSQAQATALNLKQGALQHTDSTFDLAIEGTGWFGIKGQNNATSYTRAGSFFIDANGSLVDGNGQYLLATCGNNITPTTLDAKTLAQFGSYYKAATSSAVAPYAIRELPDVPLGAVGAQSKITLPPVLYYPPIPTSEVSYGATLNPDILKEMVMVPINAINYAPSVTPTPTKQINLSGGIADTPALQAPKEGDNVFVTLRDIDGKTTTLSTTLDASLNWSFTNYDVLGLNTTANLSIENVSVKSLQEVANKERFTTPLIGPSGNRDMLDMSFTKRVPQETQGTTWDANVKILSFFENFDPTKTYDPAIYQIEKATNKVYEIIDQKSGVLTFGGSGELLSNSLPTLSNGGTPLKLNLGTIGGYDGLVANNSARKGANTAQSNGTLRGFLTDYGMDGNGNVIANFSNGKSSAVAKVAVYHFANDQGLAQISTTHFAQTANSGSPIFYKNKNGETILGSKIFSHKLEGSNVSMATALTELIVIQKAFDASAKSITTSDEMIQNAINMKQ